MARKQSTDYLTPQEVAARLRVSRRTVYNWIKDGHLGADRAGPKLWLVSHAQLDAFMKRDRVSPDPPKAKSAVPSSDLSARSLPASRGPWRPSYLGEPAPWQRAPGLSHPQQPAPLPVPPESSVDQKSDLPGSSLKPVVFSSNKSSKQRGTGRRG